MLLHKAGMEVQDIYHSLTQSLALDAEEGDVYQDAVDILTAKFKPRCNFPYERIRFRNLSQLQGETIDIYEARLRRQALNCGFGPLLDEHLRDQILDKVFSKLLKRKLIEIGPEMTLQNILDTSRSWEDANEKEDALQQVPDPPLPATADISKIQDQFRPAKRQIKCFSCGYLGHVKNSPECPAQGQECRRCRRKGHFMACCRDKPQAYQNQTRTEQRDNEGRKRMPSKKVRQVVASSSEDETECEYLFGITSCIRHLSNTEDLLTVKVGGIHLQVMVDSGASVNVIDEKTWISLKKNKIKCVNTKTNKALFPYGVKTPLTVIEKFTADVQFSEKTVVNAPFYVIKKREYPYWVERQHWN